MTLKYCIGVFEPKGGYLLREFYKCEHMGILHTEKNVEDALSVDDEYKPWLQEICKHLCRNYSDLYFSVLLLNDVPGLDRSVATKMPKDQEPD